MNWVIRAYDASLDEQQCIDLLVANIMNGAVGRSQRFIDGEKAYCEESADVMRGDMRRINEVYQERGGAFWVATDASGMVVGMVGVEHHAAHEYELRRMHVAKHAQGKGIGKGLVMHCIEFVKSKRANLDWLLRLSTMEHYQEANSLYERVGFLRLRKQPIHDSEIF